MKTAPITAQKLASLSRHYAAALRKHLNNGPRAGLEKARQLGQTAARLGLSASGLAKIHAEALAMAQAAGRGEGVIAQGRIFLAEAVAPLEEARHAALDARRHLKQLATAPGRQAATLAAVNRRLRRGVLSGEAAEKAMRENEALSEKKLAESLQLQSHLRVLTRRILSAQEDKRKKIGRELQDEIAQTLLGINVRLLTLKTAAEGSAEKFVKEVATTRRLVKNSVIAIHRFASELESHEPS
jgi:signal transduction histidine kinase